MTDTKLISIIVPVLNEQDNLAALLDRVAAVFKPLSARYDYEVVFTDNHSSDATFSRIVALAANEPRIRAYRFSRNFGYQRSILEGYRRCRGVAAIQLDCDLQDPPELIATFLELWEAGNKVVYGVRTARKEHMLLARARHAFYYIVNALSEDDLPLDAGDFRLVDRCVIDVLRRLDDAQPYLRGAIAAMGFAQVGVPYGRDERTSGESKFNLHQLLGLSLDGILNHSVVPLRIATYTGLTVAIVAVLGTLAFIAGKLALGAAWPPGFATTTILIILGIALNALFLGVIGEYLGRIYKQVKRGPNTLIEAAVEDGRLTTPETFE